MRRAIERVLTALLRRPDLAWGVNVALRESGILGPWENVGPYEARETEDEEWDQVWIRQEANGDRGVIVFHTATGWRQLAYHDILEPGHIGFIDSPASDVLAAVDRLLERAGRILVGGPPGVAGG